MPLSTDVEKVFKRIMSYTPEQLQERLAKSRNTTAHQEFAQLGEFAQFVADNAHTKPGLAALHGVPYQPAPDTTQENQNE